MSTAVLLLQPHAAGYGTIEVAERYDIDALRNQGPQRRAPSSRRRKHLVRRRRPAAAPALRSVTLWPRSYR